MDGWMGEERRGIVMGVDNGELQIGLSDSNKRQVDRFSVSLFLIS